MKSPVPSTTGTIMDVQHIVILMQENRSFDHYFGTLRGVRGFGDRFPIPVPAPPGEARSVWLQRNEQRAALVAPFHLDTHESFSQMRVASTPHTWPDAQAAWNNGILDAWPSAKQDHAMGYFSAADIPFQFALANAFTLCDAYHCSVQAGTNPNRVYAWSGTIDPFQQGHGPVIGNSYDNLNFDPAGGYSWTTYMERLQDAGISWQVYQQLDDNYADNPLTGFRQFRQASNTGGALHDRGMSTRTLEQLRADVAADQLAQVSFIVATAEGSEHPLVSSPAQGAHYTAAVLEALGANPRVWSKTVLMLMFDENDGYFDHVPPPAPPFYRTWHSDAAKVVLAGASTVSTAGEYHEFASSEASDTALYMHRPYGLGPRVPMYVVSPWSRGGWVNSQVFDHTSVIRFMEQRFGVIEPNISPWRRAVCGDLTSAFDFTRPDFRHPTDGLPATAALAERARMLPASVVPQAPAQPAVPRQERGTRPSRALPYALQVHDLADDTGVTLTFANLGQMAAVFHVYDRCALALGPYRFTVEAGKEISWQWQPDADRRYDLWVLGPNGFHRHFTGTVAVGLAVRAAYGDGTLALALVNPGPGSLACEVAGEAYASLAPWSVILAPNATATRVWDLALTANWYDLNVRVDGVTGYARRYAGRVETGRDGISDPALACPPPGRGGGKYDSHFRVCQIKAYHIHHGA